MNVRELLNLYFKKDAAEKPPVSLLINELLESWALVKDHEVNNQLLEELVFKYAEAEKQLKATFPFTCRAPRTPRRSASPGPT